MSDRLSIAVSGRFGSAVVSRDCRSVWALSHLLDARQRACVFQTLPTKKELRLGLWQSKVELGEFYFTCLWSCSKPWIWMLLSSGTLDEQYSSGRNRLNFHDRSSKGVSDQWSIINRLNEHMQGMYIMSATSPYFGYISTWYVHVYYVTLIYIIIQIKNRKIVADS